MKYSPKLRKLLDDLPAVPDGHCEWCAKKLNSAVTNKVDPTFEYADVWCNRKCLRDAFDDQGRRIDEAMAEQQAYEKEGLID